jgi:trans-aconitate methyltransferase
MRKQGLMFGEVAELYDRIRPSYPAVLVKDVLNFCRRSSPKVIEVGAGTGKATALFAPHAEYLLALEPSPEMASLGVRNCSRWPSVTFQLTTFEDWDPQESFDLLISGQAWHWTNHQARYLKANHALAPEGALAVFSYRPTWEDEALRKSLISVYDKYAPRLKSHAFPNLEHPRPESDRALLAEIESSGLFEALNQRKYKMPIRYSTDDYVDVLRTQSNHRLLPRFVRQELLARVATMIDRSGGVIQATYIVRLSLARKVS